MNEENYKPQLTPEDLQVKAEMFAVLLDNEVTEQLFATLKSDCIELDMPIREGWERLKIACSE